MGIGMMNMASGGMIGGAATAPFVQNQQQSQVNQPATNGQAKFCSNCGAPVTGKFCSNCGNQIQ